MRLERVVGPANTSVRTRYHHSFSFEPERPHIRRVRVGDSRFNRRRSAGYARPQRRYLNGAGLRKIIVNVGVACHARDVRASSQCFGELPVAFHQNGVNNIKGAMLDVAVAQPIQDWLLCAQRLLQQGLINEAALLGLSGQSGRTAKVGLIS